jgi:soluble lytic murein transglycosylase-like protein
VGILAVMLGLAAVAWVATRSKSSAPAPTPALPGRGPDAATVERVLQWKHFLPGILGPRPGLPQDVVLAQITQESEGRLGSGIGNGGGLLQVKQAALTDYNVAHGLNYRRAQLAQDGALGLEVGTWYLHERYKEFGNIRDALRAYLCGPTGARRDAACGGAYARRILDVLRPSFAR